MSATKKIFAKTFAWATCNLLHTLGWKRHTVQTNLLYTNNIAPLQKTAPIYKATLKNLTRHVGELLFCFGTYKRLPSDTAAYPCQVDGWDFEFAPGAAEVLNKMREGGIFLTAHYGNYEAIGPWLCRLGIPLVASYAPIKPRWLNRILEKRIRAVDGRNYSIDAQTPREFLRLIDEHQLFCLIADQDSRIPSALEGEFLGQKVHNNPVPDFLLKHRPQTPVFICWLDDQGPTRVLHARQVTPQGGSALGIFNNWLEGQIKKNPALWYGWTHRRFYSVNPGIYK